MSGPDGMRNLTCDEVREMASAFVIGALETDEAAAVRAHLAAHLDGHPEVADLGAVIPAFAELVPFVEPPERLKGRIMAAAAADLAARGGASGSISADAPASSAEAPASSAEAPAPVPTPVVAP
ncbi:MAG: zf-HC2 domain-containing protein, partial [Chloroflexota bacterium]